MIVMKDNFIEANIQYPENLHNLHNNLHNDLHFLPEKLKIQNLKNL